MRSEVRAVAAVAMTLLFACFVCPVCPGPGFAAEASGDGSTANATLSAADASTSRPVVTRAPASQHLVRPRPEVVERNLRRRNVLNADSTPETVRNQVGAYYRKFQKKSSTWVTPEVQRKALDRENATVTGQSASSNAAFVPVTAKVLALAVEFGGPDTFTHSATVDAGCQDETITTTGPLRGEISHPGPLDNNTVWYEPETTQNAKFYEKLIFGYHGVGRIRTDLTDPVDSLPGINLTGYTVQDYYDHMAGKGAVTLSGSVQGWVKVPHSEAYYGASNCAAGISDGGGPVPLGQLAVDSVRRFMAQHPDYYNDTSADAFWPKYDANKDGIVDTFWIIHAGMAEEAGGGTQGENSIWSQSTKLSSSARWPKGFKVYEGDPDTTEDDIYINPFTTQPENLDLGTLCEEFGHNFFGFPDLYTTDANGSIGFWAIMESGSWGGPLGGAVPVGMPFWFRMIAQCGDEFCNWDQPYLTLPYNAPTTRFLLGQTEQTPAGIPKGLVVTLPDELVAFENGAGTGKAAYTGRDTDDADLVLMRPVTIPADAEGILTFASTWDIESGWDYGYVYVQDESARTMLHDMDGYFTNENPNGNNLGYGLTGTGSATLRFDLSAYRGKTVRLRLRYKTDEFITLSGWTVDDVKLDGTLVSDFENATAPDTIRGWTNEGWQVVPWTKHYTRYYLLEWKNATKYDRMVRTAYVTTYYDDDEWRVERVPYNIPGALLYFRNEKYRSTYSLLDNSTDPPSYGPKYQLLVVDMNYQALRLGDTGLVLSPRSGSYDAALTLQKAEAWSLSQVWSGGSVVAGPFAFPEEPAVTRFDDGYGYYAGYYAGAPCADGEFCLANEEGSAVIPASGDYTTRVTHYDGTPYPDYYGVVLGDTVLGTGNPKDSGVEYGVKLKLLGKSLNNTRGILQLN